MCLSFSSCVPCWPKPKATPLQSVPSSGRFFDVPRDSGVLINLCPSGTCWIKIVKDAHPKDLHPNVHIPASLHDSLQMLGGGGSGTTVMSASAPEFGSLVLKHGDYKDTGELFALASIEQQQRARAEAHGSFEAAEDLVQRTPDFKFIYISPEHLWDRNKQSPLCRSDSVIKAFSQPAFGVKQIRNIRVCDLTYRQTSQHKEMVKLVDGVLLIYLHMDAEFDGVNDVQCSAEGEGYDYLQNLVQHLIQLQQDHGWKFTLSQKAVGGESSQTGSAFLAKASLSERPLKTLINEKIQVIRKLEALTSPEERDVVHRVREELKEMTKKDPCPSQISDFSDCFVGLAIKKNFHPESGRFKYLREIGELFRIEDFDLTEAEELPAQKLGMLLERGAALGDVFADSAGPSALDIYFDTWHDLLVHASSLHCSNALSGIWTGGIKDGGLHNLFLEEDYIWFFDMSEPGLMSSPAFLTKFLMSFYHSLGMEDTAKGDSWVNRFEPDEGEDLQLHLTAQTTRLLDNAHEAFTITVDRVVAELFAAEEGVRELLMKYVSLQLLSDGAFCLERWEVKGGGFGRKGLEKWLWRALWDIYVSSVVANKYCAVTCGKICGA